MSVGHDLYVEIAREALVRILRIETSVRYDYEWHVQFIEGYVDAIRAMENGDPTLLKTSPPERSEGYRRGFAEALRDYGIVGE